MDPVVFISSIALAVILLFLAGRKCGIKISISILGGIIIGTMAAFAISLIHSIFDVFNITLVSNKFLAIV